MEHKFKVGDKVKIIKTGSGCFTDTKGTVVTITEIGNYSGKPGYKIDNTEISTNTKSGSYNGFIGEVSFELVEKSITSESEFKIGDTVKIIKRLEGNTTGSIDYIKTNGDVGKIGKITDTLTNKFEVTELGSNNYLGWFQPNVEIELYQKYKSKPKFEIGKWYKNLGFNKTHIGKYSGWYNSKTISVSEYIYNGNIYGPSLNFTSDYEKAELLTDLSEIQAYLPDGHADKIKDLVKYEAKPFPKDNPDAFKVITKHDILANDKTHVQVSGHMPNIIPKGSISWCLNKQYFNSIKDNTELRVCPEGNRWGANIYASCFEIHPDYINHFDKPIPVESKEFNLLEEARKRYPVGTRYKCPENIGEGVYKVEDDDTMRYYDSVKNKVDIKGKG